MPFVFTRRFYFLLAFGIAMLSLGWINHSLLWLTVIYDALLFFSAALDFLASEKSAKFIVERHCDSRFSMGADNNVRLTITNDARRPVQFIVKDEYPPEMEPNFKITNLTIPAQRTKEFSYTLFANARGDYNFGSVAARYDSNLGLVWKQTKFPVNQTIKVYPNIQE